MSRITCADCGTTFRLSEQVYYDDLCPTCKEASLGETATLITNANK